MFDLGTGLVASLLAKFLTVEVFPSDSGTQEMPSALELSRQVQSILDYLESDTAQHSNEVRAKLLATNNSVLHLCTSPRHLLSVLKLLALKRLKLKSRRNKRDWKRVASFANTLNAEEDAQHVVSCFCEVTQATRQLQSISFPPSLPGSPFVLVLNEQNLVVFSGSTTNSAVQVNRELSTPQGLSIRIRTGFGQAELCRAWAQISSAVMEYTLTNLHVSDKDLFPPDLTIQLVLEHPPPPEVVEVAVLEKDDTDLWVALQLQFQEEDIAPRRTVSSHLPLSRVSVNSGEEGKCLVCQFQVRTLPCFHTFHPLCVDPWLQLKPTCPLCLTSIHSPDNAGAEETGGGQVVMQLYNLVYCVQIKLSTLHGHLPQSKSVRVWSTSKVPTGTTGCQRCTPKYSGVPYNPT